MGALFLIALIDYRRGNAARAVERLTRVVQLRPRYAEAHNNLGNALAVQRQFGKAEGAYREAIRHKPSYAEAWNNLGNVLRDQRRLDDAIACYQRALEIDPLYAECHNNRGIALARKNEYGEAIESYRRATKLRTTFAEPHNNLGIVLASQGWPAEALESFRRAIGMRPDYVDALANLALTLTELGRLDEAVAEYERALEIAPRSSRLLTALGKTLARQGKLSDAVAALRRAVDAEPTYSEAHYRLGNALRELGNLDAAELHLRQALALNPDYPEVHNSVGVLSVKRRRISDALASYETALRQRPDYAEAHLNRARAWLAVGDFRRGWVEYEWRWRCPGFQELKFSQPRWDGGLLDGKTILLWCEQGYGDTLQFVRYAKLVRQRGGRVLLRLPESMRAVLERTPGIDGLISETTALPHFDCHAPLLSLPRLLGTTLDDIPQAVPYIFPDETRVANWHDEVIGDNPEALRVGVVWRGNPAFPAERQESLRLRALAALGNVPGVRLISLQERAGTEELAEIGEPSPIWNCGEAFDEQRDAFADTAAIMMSVDLVITCDSAVAHLAGAMGVPVGVLLPYAADWRWMIEGDASPWYPSMRLFRQTTPGDWESVVETVRSILDELSGKRRTGESIQLQPRVAEGWLDHGVALAERGKLDDAIVCFRRALRFQPELPEAYNNLGNALRTQGCLDEAVSNLERALTISPNYAEAYHNLGIAYSRQHRHQEAIEQFGRAIEIKPDFAACWVSLGLSQAQLRNFSDAEASFRRALEHDPRNARLLNNLGNALADQGRREEAVEVLRRAIEVDPQCVDAFNNMGNALRELGRHEEAVASLERAIAVRPEFAEAHNNLGIVWGAKGDYQRAVACYEEALRIWPEYPAAHNNLGIALVQQKRFLEAIASYRRALELNVNYAEAYNNLGIALSQEGEYQEAIDCFRKALELRPNYAEAYSNLGITLTELGELDEALASYNEAIRIKEDYPDAYMNRALAFLVRGDFERGWREYELRWQCKDFRPRNFKPPLWNGERLDGRRILLHAEQGFGDTFQFVRYARLVKEERGGCVIVWCPRPLVPLVSQCPYVDQVTVEGEKLPEFDCHLPMLSLPQLFGTTLECVPAEVPYLFAKPELVARWHDEFSYISAFKVGINWQGNPRYRGDRHRSIPLKEYEPLAKTPGVRLISLQKGFGSEQIAQVAAAFSVTELGAHRDEETGAFMDTAAILMNLDLVVSSDTSLVHLAGGLGVPVWVALPWAADWRWLLKRTDSPWYPTMRLFRQHEPGDWQGVFQRIRDELSELASCSRTRLSRPVAVEDLLDRIAELEAAQAIDRNEQATADAQRELRELSEIAERVGLHCEDILLLRDQLIALHRRLNEARQALRDCHQRDDAIGVMRLLTTIDKWEAERAVVKQDIRNLKALHSGAASNKGR
ncbi:MAG TPA: tetratricopeptide repeat protein [Pirellulales bacterium]|nr:tetratricopeptide repeat protein [Pirellulales bacterium]